MKQFALAVSLLFLVAAGHAQTGNITISAAGATCATTNACAVLPLTNNNGGVTFTISSNTSGNTLEFEATADGVTWVSLNATPSNSTTAATNTTSTGTWQANVAGYVGARVRCSTLVSGTATVALQASTASAHVGGGGGGGTGCVPGGSAGDMLTDDGAGACSSSAVWVLTTPSLAGGATSILNLGAATGTAALIVPKHTTNTATTAGVIDYDTTNSNYHANSGADSLMLVVPTASIPVTGHLIDASVVSSKLLAHDSGLVTANVVNASSPGIGLCHFAGSTQTCTSSAVVAADTDTSIAHTGVDVNTSYQVTATHLAAALPVNQGGTGTTSTLTGLMRGNSSAMTAAEISGDCTSSGSNAVTCKPTLPAAGSSGTFSGSSYIFVCSTTCTITVPVPAAGLQYCAMNSDNVSTVITLSAIGSSARYENQARTAYGTAGTGTLVSGGAVKDSVCLLGLDSTHYLFASGQGTWTAN